MTPTKSDLEKAREILKKLNWYPTVSFSEPIIAPDVYQDVQLIAQALSAVREEQKSKDAEIVEATSKPASIPEERMALSNKDERRGIKIGWEKAQRTILSAIRGQKP